jgi:hypothetical protein
LSGRGGIEAHDKVVAGVVLRLVFRRGFGEEERAPVCKATYHAAGGENLLAGCACDPGNVLVNRQRIGLEKMEGSGRNRTL